MGDIVVQFGEVRFIGRHQRQIEFISEIDETRLGKLLILGAMALQFDIEPIAEYLHQLFDARARHLRLTLDQGFVDRPIGAAGQTDETVGMPAQIFDADMRLGRIWRIEIGAARQHHQIAIARLILGEERQARQFA